MNQHEFLKEIYKDFCIKHDMPKNEDDAYQSADDILYSYRYMEIDLTVYQKEWLENYIKLWEETNGGENI